MRIEPRSRPISFTDQSLLDEGNETMKVMKA